MPTLLEVEGLNVFRGATHVLKDVSFAVGTGALTALIGANGAGKSTTLLTLSGLLRPRSGRAVLRGADGGAVELTRAAPERIVRAGVVHCPEGRQIFRSLTVAENLAMGAYTRDDPAAVRDEIAGIHALFPLLADRAGLPAGTLSGGEQMMLAIGRALLGRPRLLLLDEPSLGLAPLIVKQIFDVIRALNQSEGLTVFLVEQNAYHALRLAHRGYVMVNGLITMSGTGKELLAREEVRAAYLEGGAH
jgi:branched-chain amino acid transport system ATP-binding protein